jgi:hypothetical protein
MSRNDGQIKGQACEKNGRQIKRHAMFRLVKKNGEANLAIFLFFFVFASDSSASDSFALFCLYPVHFRLQHFAVSLRCETNENIHIFASKHNK